MAPADSAHRAAPAPHVRVPKLAYRNRTPADHSSLSSQTSTKTSSTTTTTTTTTSTSDTPSVASTTTTTAYQNRLHPPLTPTTSTLSTTTTTTTSTPAAPSPSSSNASTARQSYDAFSFTSSSLASSNASTSSKDSKKSKKKKTNSMMGFLTLKEPSQSAFEQFAEQQRKLAAEKSGTASPNGSTNTLSYQKLPNNVPKVNSKWDGIPESLKARDSSSSASIKTKRNSGLSQATSRISSAPSASVFSLASDGSCNPPNSLASAASSVTDFPALSERRDSGPSMTPSEKTQSTLPEMTYFFPDNPDPTGALSSATTAQTSSSASTTSTVSTPVTASSISIEEAAIIAVTTPPALGRENSELDAEAAALLKRMHTHGFMAGEAQEVRYDDDSDSDESGTHDFLFNAPTMAIKDASLLASNGVSRSPMNFSRPLSSPQKPSGPDRSRSSASVPARTGVSRLPTLYEASIASTADSVDTVVDLPEVYEPSIADSDAISISPSINSVTPSEMSASWYRSPRERLGLGGRIRKNDVLPWEKSADLEPGKRKKNPLSMFRNS